jgi:hypothetical protein
MKLNFDVNKSLELSPPKYLKGIKFKKRIVLNRNKVTYPKQNNPRLLNIVAERIPEIRDSFLVNGFIHSCPPPTIKVDPNNSDRFIGLSGYHRNAAAEQADCDTMIYDVLEFDSPLDERKHRIISNHHIVPVIPNTLDDLVKQVLEAVNNNEIPNDENEIKDFIKIIAADKTDENKNVIYKRFRKFKSSSSTLLCYHAGKGENSTKELAINLDLPYSGDKNFTKSGKLGYITSQPTPRIALFDAKTLFRKKGSKQKIQFYAYISSPLEGAGLRKQRKIFKSKFENFILSDCQSTKNEIEKLGLKVSLDDIIKNHPIQFVGFLPQDISPDPFKNGRAKEETIVDCNGNPVNLTEQKTNRLLDVRIRNKVEEILGTNEDMPQELLDIMNI